MKLDNSTVGRMKIYVHLAYGFGTVQWGNRWRAGELLGINEDNAYGYLRANEMGCNVVVSADKKENALDRLFRLGLRAVSGFDIVHAWRNRRELAAADVVWTHTESQALAVLTLGLFKKSAARPKTISQTVWLMDNWKTFSAIKRKTYKALLNRSDVLTFLSPTAADFARSLFSQKKVEFVKYGIATNVEARDPVRPIHLPVRILSLGNDRHRDWPTLISALANDKKYVLKTVTQVNLSKLTGDAKNITVESPANNKALMELYDWADIVVVCLQENLHASGITVIEEAVIQGIPVICTNTGGLTEYFDASELYYIEPSNPGAVREAIDHLVQDETHRTLMVERAYRRMREGDINSNAYVARHVSISRDLVSLPNASTQ